MAVAIAMKVDGASYEFTGQAVCEHVPKGSIYNTLAERWSVRHNEKGRSLSLTLWRPLAGGGDMVTLSVSTGDKRYDVNTVKNPSGTQTSGTGSVKLAPQSKGGAFTVDVSTASGARLSGAIKCDAFTTPEVVAGN